MQESSSQAKKAFTTAAVLTPELEADFKKRSAAFRDFASLHPEASLDDLAAYRAKVKPKDRMEAKLFEKWCVLELKKELVNK